MIHSLTGSKQTTRAWVAVLIKENDCLKLNILDSTPLSIGASFTVNNISEGQENSKNSSRIVTVNGPGM